MSAVISLTKASSCSQSGKQETVLQRVRTITNDIANRVFKTCILPFLDYANLVTESGPFRMYPENIDGNSEQ